MSLVHLSEAKEYLRVDTSDEDALIESLLSAAEKLCLDVARIDSDAWNSILNGEAGVNVNGMQCTPGEAAQIRELMRIAILYALAYLYEHREEADHRGLTLTLRSLLFSVREGVL